MDVTAGDLVEELRAYHALYSPLFQRREPREWAGKSVHGLLLDWPRQSIAPLVLAWEGAQPQAVRAMQQFIREGSGDDTALLPRHWPEVHRELGEDDGVLILDGSAFPQQGRDSVGVQRQERGELGQRAHGQAGVCWGDASRQGSTRPDRRRYVPQAWVAEAASAERRRRCGVPKEMTCTTQPRLGWERIPAVQQAHALRWRWVTCDEAFGRDTDLLDRSAAVGLWSFAEGPHATQLWPQRPATVLPTWSGQGRPPTRRRVRAADPEPLPVAPLAARGPAPGWQRQTIQEGRKGPLGARVAKVRVLAGREGVPGPEGWLVLRDPVGTGALKPSLSHAPATTALAMVVWVSGRRWPIATCVEDGKH